MKIENRLKKLYEYRQLIWLILVIAFSALLFGKISQFSLLFDRIMVVSAYLSWHTLFEFISILVSLCVFILPYYSYRQTHRLRGIFIANVFLTMGIIDMFHTLSFKGMPYFLIENDNANRATTFWVIARLIGAVGITVGSFIKINKKSQIDRKVFLGFSIALSLIVMIVVTYFPYLLPAMYIEGVGITQIKIILEYIIIMFLCFAGILYLRQYLKKKDKTNLVFAIAIIMSIFSEIAFVKYTSVYDIYNYLGHVYKFISYFMVFRVSFVNNIEKPYLALFEARNKLNEYALDLNRLVDERTLELNQKNQKLLEDLAYARDIQKAMLPDVLPNNDDVSFEAKYYPAERVSGDFYNIFRLDEQRIGMYIGDVSGHGVPAAMLTVFLNQSIKTARESEDNRLDIISPSMVLKNLYESYNKVNFNDEVYILALYAIYNVKTRELIYASAGMNVRPILVKGNNMVSELDIKGLPICKLLNIYDAEYEDKTIRLESGDKVFFYTDGLVELNDANTGKEVFPEARLKGLLVDCNNNSVELCKQIDEEIKYFTENNVLKDDITFFIMHVN